MDQSDHDPLCPQSLPLLPGTTCNYCALIANARADEKAKADFVISFWVQENRTLRERIVKGIEALPDAHRKKSKMGGKGFGKWGGDGSIWRMDAIQVAQGGTDG